jgi:hypothetical protein
VYLPGSFNPLHEGHKQMLAAAVKLAGPDYEGCFELTVQNADKVRAMVGWDGRGGAVFAAGEGGRVLAVDIVMLLGKLRIAEVEWLCWLVTFEQCSCAEC